MGRNFVVGFEFFDVALHLFHVPGQVLHRLLVFSDLFDLLVNQLVQRFHGVFQKRHAGFQIHDFAFSHVHAFYR